MATKTYPNILKYGLQASYDALGSKDSNVLYFCTDTKKIYKGDIDFTDSVVLAATKPATSIIAGKLYVIADTGTVEVYSGGAWHVVSYPVATTISAASDDVHVATAKAVYDYVDDAIADNIEDVTQTHQNNGNGNNQNSNSGNRPNNNRNNNNRR